MLRALALGIADMLVACKRGLACLISLSFPLGSAASSLLNRTSHAPNARVPDVTAAGSSQSSRRAWRRQGSAGAMVVGTRRD